MANISIVSRFRGQKEDLAADSSDQYVKP